MRANSGEIRGGGKQGKKINCIEWIKTFRGLFTYLGSFYFLPVQCNCAWEMCCCYS